MFTKQISLLLSVRVSIFTHPSVVHHIVLERSFTSGALHLHENLDDFLPRCIIEASACKITQAKAKDGRIGTSPG